MKTIGLIGGMSWESTASYYRAINQGVKASLGGLHSAKICLISVDFHEVEVLQSNGNWGAAATLLSDEAKKVEAGGADFFLICTNTMHKVAQRVESEVSIPLLHIADATARVLIADGVSKVGLLGTAFTMEQAFYKNRLIDHGVDVLVPDEAGRKIVHDIIYNELCLGTIAQESRQCYLNVVDQLAAQGAQAIILGCTEIGLLISQSDTEVRLYDTTEIHAASAVELALSE